MSDSQRCPLQLCLIIIGGEFRVFSIAKNLETGL